MLLLAAPKAGAQLAPPDDFFNRGAQLYISNNIPAAKGAVAAGLQMYPDDEKLKKLEELLKQQQQSQGSQSQPSPDNSQPQKSDQQKNQPPQKNPPARPKPDQSKQNQADQPPAEPKKPADEKAETPADKGKMTPEEARQLLDTEKGNEQILKFTPPAKPKNPNRPVKDW
jgi:hypothetical protein